MSFSQFNAFSRCKPIQQIDLVDLFCKISNQKIDVVLRDVQIAVTEYTGQRYHISAA